MLLNALNLKVALFLWLKYFEKRVEGVNSMAHAVDNYVLTCGTKLLEKL